jgi:hypothetical protein
LRRRWRLFFDRRWGSRLTRNGGRCFRSGRRSWRRGLTRTTTGTRCRRLARRLRRRRLIRCWGRGGGPFGCRRSRRGAGCWGDPTDGRPRSADPGACRCQACAHVLAHVLYALLVYAQQRRCLDRPVLHLLQHPGQDALNGPYWTADERPVGVGGQEGQQRDYHHGRPDHPCSHQRVPPARANEAPKEGLRPRKEGRGFFAPTPNYVADHLQHK